MNQTSFDTDATAFEMAVLSTCETCGVLCDDGECDTCRIARETEEHNQEALDDAQSELDEILADLQGMDAEFYELMDRIRDAHQARDQVLQRIKLLCK